MRFQASLLPLWLHAHPKSLWPLTFTSQTNRVRALYSKSGFVLCCSRTWGTEGSLELSWKPLTSSSSSLLPRLTLLAGLPLFFLFKNTYWQMCLCFKKVLKNVILTSLFWGTGREGRGGETELVVTMLLILTLDVKLQMLIINKIYIQS